MLAAYENDMQATGFDLAEVNKDKFLMVVEAKHSMKEKEKNNED